MRQPRGSPFALGLAAVLPAANSPGWHAPGYQINKIPYTYLPTYLPTSLVTPWDVRRFKFCDTRGAPATMHPVSWPVLLPLAPGGNPWMLVENLPSLHSSFPILFGNGDEKKWDRGNIFNTFVEFIWCLWEWNFISLNRRGVCLILIANWNITNNYINTIFFSRTRCEEIESIDTVLWIKWYHFVITILQYQFTWQLDRNDAREKIDVSYTHKWYR